MPIHGDERCVILNALENFPDFLLRISETLSLN